LPKPPKLVGNINLDSKTEIPKPETETKAVLYIN